jgi:hypothetical protein
MDTTDRVQQLQEQITDAVAELSTNTQWRAMLDLSRHIGSRYSTGTTRMFQPLE